MERTIAKIFIKKEFIFKEVLLGILAVALAVILAISIINNDSISRWVSVLNLVIIAIIFTLLEKEKSNRITELETKIKKSKK